MIVKLDDASDADFSVTEVIRFALLVTEVLGGSGKGQENDRCVVQCFCDVSGEAQVVIDGFLHDFFEARLVNWRLAFLALFDSEGVNVIHDELKLNAEGTSIEEFWRAKTEAVGIPTKPAPKTATL